MELITILLVLNTLALCMQTCIIEDLRKEIRNIKFEKDIMDILNKSKTREVEEC